MLKQNKTKTEHITSTGLSQNSNVIFFTTISRETLFFRNAVILRGKKNHPLNLSLLSFLAHPIIPETHTEL